MTSIPFSSALPMIIGSCLGLLAVPVVASTQDDLQMIVNPEVAQTLKYDWPTLRVGIGEYRDGPTGVTVFQFDQKASVAVDVRGGGPGTVNAPYMNLGYDMPELDAIVFAGGSWYGLEATTAVATALKDDGVRDGDAFSQVPNIAMSVGSIIFDFGGRRLNEIYPDKRLAQAALRAAKTGWFPQGPHGAGAFAQTGALFGCNAYSGQGGAYEQFGRLKIAVFSVVNALGVVTDRDGRVAACYGDQQWPADLTSQQLLAMHLQASKKTAENHKKNTTISLVVTNQKLDPATLKRLAVQVHTSMARALQPFASIYDGDVLYAVSTNEIDNSDFSTVDLGVAASKLMWDAILNSVPPQPERPISSGKRIDGDVLSIAPGTYEFSDGVTFMVTEKGGRLYGQAVGDKPVYAFEKNTDTEIRLSTGGQLFVPSRYPMVLDFQQDRVLVNPGRWQQIGIKR